MTHAPAEWPRCHRLGVEPEGYRREREGCQDCRDKFTCAAATRAAFDEEIRAVFASRISLEQGIGRVEIRTARKAKGLNVPASLLPGARIVGPGEVVAEGRKRVIARTNPKYPGRPREYERGGVARVYTRGGRAIPLPVAEAIGPDAMTSSLLALDIGQRVPLRIGQSLKRTIIRGPRAGASATVTFTPRGYEIDGIVFGSLSSALTWFAGFHRGPRWATLGKKHTTLHDSEGQKIQ